jgi:hypothetical protein
MSDGTGETLVDGAPEGPQLATGNRPTTFWWRRTRTVSSVPPICRYMPRSPMRHGPGLRRNDVEALFNQPVPWSRRSGRPRGELDAVMSAGRAIMRRLPVA